MPKKVTQKSSTSKGSNRRSLNIKVRQLIDEYIYRIDLDADYQREKVWSKKHQELLLDSMLTNIDIPKLYLAETTESKQFDYECIDGKQRMLTLLHFFKPDRSESPVLVEIFDRKYTYEELKQEHPNLATKIEDFELNFIIYNQADLSEKLIREIFRRLQLGIRLNSGELLHSQSGKLRDFIFKEIGKDGPFFRFTNLSEKRFSREFTLAQICINSFERAREGAFVRARLEDLQYFIDEESKLAKDDENLTRIKKVLAMMDKSFGDSAEIISSRASAVSAFLFIESLYSSGKLAQVPKFTAFYVNLLEQIKANMVLLQNYERPQNTMIMDEFQKYILQASVEPYSIKRRDDFLQKAFAYFLDPRTKGKIIGGN